MHVGCPGSAVFVLKITKAGRVGDGEIVREGSGNTTEERRSVRRVQPTIVPTVGPTTVNGDVVGRGILGQRTHVGERLDCEGVAVAVEEVIRSGNDFVTDDRVEVTNFDGQVVVGDFAVELRQSRAVVIIVTGHPVRRPSHHR